MAGLTRPKCGTCGKPYKFSYETDTFSPQCTCPAGKDICAEEAGTKKEF